MEARATRFLDHAVMGDVTELGLVRPNFMVLGFVQLPASGIPSWILKDAKLDHRVIAKIESVGGSRPGKQLVTVCEDGTVRLSEVHGDGKPGIRQYRLSRDQVSTLKDLIQTTDFDRLADTPRATFDPQAVDGVDHLFVLRKGRKIVWWSNAVYQHTREGRDLFRYLEKIAVDFPMDRRR